GGGGAYAKKNTLTVTSGQVISYYVGESGLSNPTQSGNGGNGGDSWFLSNTTVLAKGGSGGTGGNAGAGGAGGLTSSSIGDVKYAGGYGGTGAAATASSASGAGGGSAGTTSAGNFTSATLSGTAPTAVTGGVAGVAGITASGGGSGNNGLIGGGGGSGGKTNNGTTAYRGGNGGIGNITITFTLPTPTITSISPVSGCPGSTITIIGTNLGSATAANVKIGGTAVASITSVSATQIVAVVGSGTNGFVTVTTSTTATSSQSYTVLSVPPAPVTNSAGSITASTATVSWAASAGATSYRLDVATDAAFTALVSGFNDLNIGNVTSYTLTGLTVNTTYYYRVRGNNGSCSGANSSTISFFTGFVVPATGSNSYTACSGNIYDPGILGDYPINANGFTTIYPGTPGSFVKLTFNFLTVETCCDYIKIYNGNSTAAPLIGQYTASPGVIQSTALDGSLTIQFVSDGSVVYAGFDASISCIAPCSGTPSVGEAVAWSPTAITGFNADVIANGVGAASSSSSQFDTGGFALVSADFQSSTSSTLPTYSLPITGIVNSSSNAGVNYQLANYTGNNSLRLVGATSCLLTLVNTNKAKRVAILTSSGSGTSVFTAQINFSDGTNQIFASNSVQDWYGSTYSIAPIGRVPLTTGIPEGTSTQPGLYDVILTLSAGNQSKTITSILITKTDAVASALNILGISLSTNTPTSVLCNGQSRILSLPDLNSTTPGLTYQWQTSSLLSGPWSNITGATTTTYTTPALTTAGIVYYKCVVTCTNSISSASSTPIAINVNPTFIINPSTGAVCLGSSLQAIPSSNSTYLWSN
ncbi:MAG: IPT/TIG domain-containing protein, partial [Crocinitomicaceae bacterium]|nr:IPT/TIG domain-containing protein [Crocinitomicaceae bacterium]